MKNTRTFPVSPGASTANSFLPVSGLIAALNGRNEQISSPDASYFRKCSTFASVWTVTSWAESYGVSPTKTVIFITNKHAVSLSPETLPDLEPAGGRRGTDKRELPLGHAGG